MGDVECQICGQKLKKNGLAKHINASHSMACAEYYTTYFPRFSLLDKKPIRYKNYDQYFSTDFIDRNEFKRYLNKADDAEARDWVERHVLELLDDKKREYMFSHAEMKSYDKLLLSMSDIVRIYGSVDAFCSEVGKKPLFSTNVGIVSKQVLVGGEILIDTREQDPLEFPNSRVQKLAVGDYCLPDDAYTYTYVDRKSEDDFKSTVTTGFDRFCREMDRCKSIDSYMYVVVESSIRRINENRGYHKSNLSWVWSQMRKLQSLYPENLQFVFTGNRRNSEGLVPYLLAYGEELWGVDVQFYLEGKGIL